MEPLSPQLVTIYAALGPLAQFDALFGGSGEGSDGSGTFLPGLMMAAGVALLLGVVLINLRRRMSRNRQHEALDPHERLERMRQTQGMQNDLRDMMVELEELTRRFSAQLDAKSARLEQQLQQAEQTITELQRLQGQPGNGAASGSADGSARGATDGSLRSDASSNGTGSGNDSPSTPERAQNSAGSPTEDGGQSEESVDPLAARVYELADAGHEPVEIALQLNEQIGKVELILALRQQQ